MKRLTYMYNGACQIRGADNALCKEVCDAPGRDSCYGCPINEAFNRLKFYEDAVDEGRLVELPCKIGDMVWGIRRHNRWGTSVAQGTVYQMFYGDDMQLCISVKGVCRGLWGERVFASREEAEAALAKEKRYG